MSPTGFSILKGDFLNLLDGFEKIRVFRKFDEGFYFRG